MSDLAFLAAARVALGLIDEPAVAERWNAPSALPEMTVGMLACHLGRQTVRAAEILAVPAEDEPLAEAAEHYRRAAWVHTSDLAHPANDRTVDEQEAAAGVGGLRRRAAAALLEVERLLGDDPPAVVTIPWQGWSLRRADFLLTRMVELVVHTDDLAHSAGVPTPTFPEDAYLPVATLLVRLASERHGQSALIGALTRRERMPSTISAF